MYKDGAATIVYLSANDVDVADFISSYLQMLCNEKFYANTNKYMRAMFRYVFIDNGDR